MVRRTAMQNADGIATTCALALQQKVFETITPGIICKGEDRKSIAPYFYALAGVYDPEHCFILAADLKQQDGHMKTYNNPNSINPFANFCKYSAFQRFREAGLKTITVYEQHRIWAEALVKWMSFTYYKNAIRDGNLDKPLLQKSVLSISSSFSSSRLRVTSLNG
jgi:hypothetical protein